MSATKNEASDPPGILVSVVDGRRVEIGSRPIQFGRDTRCDVVLDDPHASRVHCSVMRTPTGVIIVDSSLHGTFVNGDGVQAQRLLEPGDVISVAGRSFRFEVAEVEPASGELFGSTVRARPDWSLEVGARTTKVKLLHNLAQQPGSRWMNWLRRYGLAEVSGVIAAISGYWLGDLVGHNPVVAAYGASLGESLGFYGVLIIQSLIHDAYAAGARRAAYGGREIAATWRDLVLEFGVAEVIDTGFLRPLCMGVGTTFLGPELGVAAGKIVGDVAFYGPLIATYEVRRHFSSREPTRFA